MIKEKASVLLGRKYFQGQCKNIESASVSLREIIVVEEIEIFTFL
jgi:hypothetical protein